LEVASGDARECGGWKCDNHVTVPTLVGNRAFVTFFQSAVAPARARTAAAMVVAIADACTHRVDMPQQRIREPERLLAAATESVAKLTLTNTQARDRSHLYREAESETSARRAAGLEPL
jgi:hypothetical protein